MTIQIVKIQTLFKQYFNILTSPHFDINKHKIALREVNYLCKLKHSQKISNRLTKIKYLLNKALKQNVPYQKINQFEQNQDFCSNSKIKQCYIYFQHLTQKFCLIHKKIKFTDLPNIICALANEKTNTKLIIGQIIDQNNNYVNFQQSIKIAIQKIQPHKLFQRKQKLKPYRRNINNQSVQPINNKIVQPINKQFVYYIKIQQIQGQPMPLFGVYGKQIKHTTDKFYPNIYLLQKRIGQKLLKGEQIYDFIIKNKRKKCVKKMNPIKQRQQIFYKKLTQQNYLDIIYNKINTKSTTIFIIIKQNQYNQEIKQKMQQLIKCININQMLINPPERDISRAIKNKQMQPMLQPMLFKLSQYIQADLKPYFKNKLKNKIGLGNKILLVHTYDNFQIFKKRCNKLLGIQCQMVEIKNNITIQIQINQEQLLFFQQSLAQYRIQTNKRIFNQQHGSLMEIRFQGQEVKKLNLIALSYIYWASISKQPKISSN